MFLRPLQYGGRDSDGAPVGASIHRAGRTGVTCCKRKRTEILRLEHIFWNLNAVPLQDFQEVFEVVSIREFFAATNEEGFDGFFRGLLRVKAQIFKIRVGHDRLGASEVSVRPTEPFARIVWWKPLASHK